MTQKEYFIKAMNNQINSESYTENGALGYKTAGKSLVDFNFKLPSYRKDKNLMIEDFNKILADREPYALKYLFYMRDIRGGLGERDAFRECFCEYISKSDLSDEQIYSLIYMIPFYGRWDDLWSILDTEYASYVANLVEEQLHVDMIDMENHNGISLLAKWMPSDNATSPKTKRYAKILCNYLKLSVKNYRKMLVTLRAYLDVTEVKTCANRWSDIDYNKVSSNANLRYSDAFLKHDLERRRTYLSALAEGKKDVKMHSATNFAHDIVHKYGGYWRVNTYDEAIEQLWKNLPDLPGLGDTLVVRDGSGSMTSQIPGSGCSALDVANALSIYCSARCKGCFENNFITFSSRPQLVDISACESLHDKLEELLHYDDCSNTNLKATFELVLRTAVANKMSQEDMPNQLLIISDMEFDQGCSYSKTLFKEIADEFAAAGYKLPRLVFWNVNSRTNTIPLKENDNGVVLVSGFSVHTINMINNGETDPYKALIKELDSERYEKIPLIS